MAPAPPATFLQTRFKGSSLPRGIRGKRERLPLRCHGHWLGMYHSRKVLANKRTSRLELGSGQGFRKPQFCSAAARSSVEPSSYACKVSEFHHMTLLHQTNFLPWQSNLSFIPSDPVFWHGILHLVPPGVLDSTSGSPVRPQQKFLDNQLSTAWGGKRFILGFRFSDPQQHLTREGPGLASKKGPL